MKRLKLVALVLALACLPMAVFAQRDLTLKVNGKIVESKPATYIEKDRTMVPIRFVADAMGFTTSVSGVKDKQVIEIQG